MFDIVILVGPNDTDIINNQIEFTKKNVMNYRKIYIVSNYITQNINGCEIINETIFDFNNDDIIKYIGNRKRTKWYLQQLIKLYASICIPDILDEYLIIDSDTFFIKPTLFFSNKNIALFNTGLEYHLPYFEHMKKLHPSLIKMLPDNSGITHHMLFQKKYLLSLFKLIEDYHNKKFWIVFLESVDSKEYDGSGASEYEIYFNFMLQYYPKNIEIRKLNFKNVDHLNLLNTDNQYDYISYHWYCR
jgi:hypothetical protein